MSTVKWKRLEIQGRPDDSRGFVELITLVMSIGPRLAVEHGIEELLRVGESCASGRVQSHPPFQDA